MTIPPNPPDNPLNPTVRSTNTPEQRDLSNLARFPETPQEARSLQGRVEPLEAAFSSDADIGIERYLNLWVQDGEIGGGREEAKERIMEFLNNSKAYTIDLNNLDLRLLPDIFHITAFTTRLTNLFINCHLNQLPPSMSQLTALTVLFLFGNQLVVLPPEIGNLTALTTLSLSDNQLSELPPEIWNLTALTTLSLSNNQLSDLPSAIGNLRALQRFILSNNQLSEFPPEVGNLTALTFLDLRNNRLSALPPEVDNLTALTNLRLSNNPSLEGLPLEILNLPRQCMIDISGCGFTRAVLDRLREATENPGYRGPRISYSMTSANPRAVSDKPANELLRDLYAAIDQPYELLSNIPGPVVSESVLQSWLSRLSWMSDYNSSPKRKRWLITNIIKYLKLADINENFRQEFATIITGADITCGDRIALSVLYLGVAHRLATIEPNDIKALAEFLKRGVWALSILEKCARDKTPTLPFFDEIEVYLGYPVMLKEKLQLPIDIEEMLYFRCSALNNTDLDEAYNTVSSHLKNPNEYHNFLINDPRWEKALQLKYPPGFAAITRKKELDLGAAVTAEDYQKIEAEYRTGLIDLTKKALS